MLFEPFLVHAHPNQIIIKLFQTTTIKPSQISKFKGRITELHNATSCAITNGSYCWLINIPLHLMTSNGLHRHHSSAVCNRICDNIHRQPLHRLQCSNVHKLPSYWIRWPFIEVIATVSTPSSVYLLFIIILKLFQDLRSPHCPTILSGARCNV